MSQGIENKMVVIIGASSGLAKPQHAISPSEVVPSCSVPGARRRDRIDALAEELTSTGYKARAVQTDVTDRQQVKNLVDTAVREFGRIDVMLNNAGLMPLAPIERLKVDEWDRMIDVNTKLQVGHGVRRGRTRDEWFHRVDGEAGSAACQSRPQSGNRFLGIPRVGFRGDIDESAAKGTKSAFMISEQSSEAGHS